MRKAKPTYQQLLRRLATAEPIVAALQRQEVDAVVGEEKIAFLLLRKVEEAWLESNGEFSAMFNLAGIGMFQADAPAFRFSRVNQKFCEITGFSAEELLTKTDVEITHPQDRKRALRELARVIRGSADSWSIEKRCVHKDGRDVWVVVHGAALRDPAGRAVMILAMVEDVTARKQAEQQQRDTQDQLARQLRERTAEMSQMMRSLRNPAAKHKLADQMLSAIQEFTDRFIHLVGESSTVGRKPRRRKESSRRQDSKSTGRKSPRKKRPAS